MRQRWQISDFLDLEYFFIQDRKLVEEKDERRRLRLRGHVEVAMDGDPVGGLEAHLAGVGGLPRWGHSNEEYSGDDRRRHRTERTHCYLHSIILG